MTTLNVIERGSGIPLLALHGFGPDHRLMLGTFEPVAERQLGWRRIYPDLPGFGRSPIGDVASSAEVVDALEELVTELLGDQEFALAGESWGGYLAAELTQRRPEQVLGLALIVPLVIPEFGKRDVPAFQVVQRDPDAAADLELAERVQFETSMVVQTAETLARFTQEVAAGLEIAHPATNRLQSHGYALPTSPFAGDPYRRPTLILTGRQDPIVGFRDQFNILDHFPRATYVVLDGAGHNPAIESASATTDLIADWLGKLLA